MAQASSDRDGCIEHRAVRRSTPVMPEKTHRPTPRESDLLERFFNIIKHIYAIATRSETTDSDVLAGVHPVCAQVWLK